MFQFDLKTQNELQSAYMVQEKVYKIRKMILCKIRHGRPLNLIDKQNIEKYMITFSDSQNSRECQSLNGIV